MVFRVSDFKENQLAELRQELAQGLVPNWNRTGYFVAESVRDVEFCLSLEDWSYLDPKFAFLERDLTNAPFTDFPEGADPPVKVYHYSLTLQEVTE